MEENNECSVTLSNLTCLEDGNRLDEDEDDEGDELCISRKRKRSSELLFLWNNNDSTDDIEFATEDDENEYIEMLVEKEISLISGCDQFSSTATVNGEQDWMKLARSEAVQWILKMRSCFGFAVQTAYLAVVYFDRFFACRMIDKGKIWAVQLVAIACLSLAAKMEECRAPALMDYQIDELQFDCNTIRRMEFMVLSALDWRMNSITPFSYLKHFVSKLLPQDDRKQILFKATGLILSTIQGMNLIDYRPSTIATAAVLAASDSGLTKKMVEGKMSFISTEVEQVFSCYSRVIQESHKQGKLNNNNQSKNLASSSEQSSFDSLMTRCSKRRRLDFTQIP